MASCSSAQGLPPANLFHPSFLSLENNICIKLCLGCVSRCYGIYEEMSLYTIYPLSDGRAMPV